MARKRPKDHIPPPPPPLPSPPLAPPQPQAQDFIVSSVDLQAKRLCWLFKLSYL